MPQAILIYGNSQRFSDESVILRSYLKKETDTRILREIPTPYVSEDIVAFRLERAFMKRTKDPLLVLFTGHGSETGWAFDDDRRIPYTKLAESLQHARRPVTIINDTCHAMALAVLLEQMKKAGAAVDRVSLIAACEADATAIAGLVPQVLHCWRQRKAHPSGPKTRWGAELDHHFFAKTPEPP